jgi:hypothetical protein
MTRDSHESAPSHPYTAQPEPEPVLSRRDFLKFGAVAGGTAVGILGDKIIDNERLQQRFWFDTEVLKETARAQPGLKRLGFYPDFDAGERVAWNQVVQYLHEIGQVQLLGVFGRLEELYDPAYAYQLATTMQRIGYYDAKVVYSVGTGGKLWQGHPFARENRQILLAMIGRAIDVFNSAQVDGILRILYEANNRKRVAFSYGVGGEMTETAHSQAYAEIFDWTMNEIEQRATVSIELVSAQSVQHAVAPYVPKVDGRVRAHGVGLDGYALYPGPGQWDKLHYWVPGYQAPEAVFYSPLRELQEAAGGQVPISIYELGQIEKDAAWLQQAALLLFAMGGQDLMYFDYDKSATGKRYETNWRMTPEIMQMFRYLLNEIIQPEIR